MSSKIVASSRAAGGQVLLIEEDGTGWRLMVSRGTDAEAILETSHENPSLSAAAVILSRSDAKALIDYLLPMS